MERATPRRLATWIVFFGLFAVVTYYLIPSSGASEFSKMNAALQNARSWRLHSAQNESTRTSSSDVEVYCPSRLHSKTKLTADESGQHVEQENEIIWVVGSLYTRKGSGWVLTQETRLETATCARGPRGSDELLGQMDTVLRIGKIRKGEKREVNGERCRDWIASVPAPAGWREAFGVCIGGDHLPREVFTPDRSQVSTYSDWNTPIRIEAPDPDAVVPP